METMSANNRLQATRIKPRAAERERYALNCPRHLEFGNIHKLMESHYGRFT